LEPTVHTSPSLVQKAEWLAPVANPTGVAHPLSLYIFCLEPPDPIPTEKSVPEACVGFEREKGDFNKKSKFLNAKEEPSIGAQRVGACR
jgi:hypothetical protein